jgi:hypothetical protein
MTPQLSIILLVLAVLVVYLVIAARTWSHVHGARVVVCPETQKAAAVRVDVGHAMASAVRERPDLRLTSCSRWPERQECDQRCVRQIETAPSETAPKTIAAHFFTGERCAICTRAIEAPNAMTLQPGFMDPATHRVHSWDEVPPQDLTEVMATRYPLCSNCTLAEAFRQRFPDRVTDRRPH